MSGIDFKNYVTQWFENRYICSQALFYNQIHLLRDCEYNCLHCYFKEIKNKGKNRLIFAEVKTIIDKINSTAINFKLTPRIDFVGGDPLLHPDFFRIAEYSISQGVKFGIKGNPDLLNGNNLNNLRRLNVQEITLSLEGMEPVHDNIRGKGSFAKTVETIGKLKNEGFIVRIHTTISKFNSDQLLPILDFLISNNFLIDDLTWSRFWSVTDSNDMIDKSNLLFIFQNLVSSYEKIFSNKDFFIINKDGRLIPKIFIGFKEHLWFPFLAEKGYIDNITIKKILDRPNSINCTATRHVYTIDTDGEVYKCRKIVNSSIGNIINDEFKDMFNTDTALKFIHLNTKSACGKCQYFNGCGGCAAIAEAKRKSIFAGDADCFIKGSPSSIA